MELDEDWDFEISQAEHAANKDNIVNNDTVLSFADKFHLFFDIEEDEDESNEGVPQHLSLLQILLNNPKSEVEDFSHEIYYLYSLTTPEGTNFLSFTQFESWINTFSYKYQQQKHQDELISYIEIERTSKSTFDWLRSETRSIARLCVQKSDNDFLSLTSKVNELLNILEVKISRPSKDYVLFNLLILVLYNIIILYNPSIYDSFSRVLDRIRHLFPLYIDYIDFFELNTLAHHDSSKANETLIKYCLLYKKMISYPDISHILLNEQVTIADIQKKLVLPKRDISFREHFKHPLLSPNLSNEEIRHYISLEIAVGCLSSVTLYLQGFSPINTKLLKKEAYFDFSDNRFAWISQAEYNPSFCASLFPRTDIDIDDESKNFIWEFCGNVAARIISLEKLYRKLTAFDMIKAMASYCMGSYYLDTSHDSELTEIILFESVYILDGIHMFSSLYESTSLISEISTNLILAYSNVLLSNKKYQLAQILLDSLLTCLTNEDEIKLYTQKLLDIAYENEDWINAVKYCNMLLSKAQENSNIQEIIYLSQMISKISLKLGDFYSAEANLQSAIKSLKSFIPLRESFSSIRFEMNNMKSEQNVNEGGLPLGEFRTPCIDLYLKLAKVYVDGNRLSLAYKTLKALYYSGLPSRQSIMAILLLAKICMKRRHFEKASSFFIELEQAIAKSSGESKISSYNTRGNGILFSSPSLDGLSSPSVNEITQIELLTMKARLALRTHRYQDAQGFVQKALGLCPVSSIRSKARLQFLLAKILQAVCFSKFKITHSKQNEVQWLLPDPRYCVESFKLAYENFRKVDDRLRTTKVLISISETYLLLIFDLIAVMHVSIDQMRNWIKSVDPDPRIHNSPKEQNNFISFVEKPLQQALESVTSFLDFVLFLRCYIGLAELKFLQNNIKGSQAYWKEFTTTLFTGFINARHVRIFSKVSPGMSIKLSNLFSRCTRLLMCYDTKFINSHLFIIDQWIRFHTDVTFTYMKSSPVINLSFEEIEKTKSRESKNSNITSPALTTTIPKHRRLKSDPPGFPLLIHYFTFLDTDDHSAKPGVTVRYAAMIDQVVSCFTQIQKNNNSYSEGLISKSMCFLNNYKELKKCISLISSLAGFMRPVSIISAKRRFSLIGRGDVTTPSVTAHSSRDSEIVRDLTSPTMLARNLITQLGFSDFPSSSSVPATSILFPYQPSSTSPAEKFDNRNREDRGALFSNIVYILPFHSYWLFYVPSASRMQFGADFSQEKCNLIELLSYLYKFKTASPIIYSPSLVLDKKDSNIGMKSAFILDDLLDYSSPRPRRNLSFHGDFRLAGFKGHTRSKTLMTTDTIIDATTSFTTPRIHPFFDDSSKKSPSPFELSYPFLIDLLSCPHSTCNFASTNELFRALDPQHVLTLIAAVLCEARIVLSSSSDFRINAVLNSLVWIIYPFSWQHLFIPLLAPSALAILYLKQPFIIGIRSKSINEDSLPSDIFFCHLDENTLKYPRELFPILPNPFRKILNKLIISFTSNVFRTERESEMRERKFISHVASCTQSDSDSPDTLSPPSSPTKISPVQQFNDLESAKFNITPSRSGKRASQTLFNQSEMSKLEDVHKGFYNGCINLWAKIFHRYPLFSNTNEFIKDFSLDQHPFLRAVTSTAAFTQLQLHSRLPKCSNKYDEAVLEYLREEFRNLQQARNVRLNSEMQVLFQSKEWKGKTRTVQIESNSSEIIINRFGSLIVDEKISLANVELIQPPQTYEYSFSLKSLSNDDEFLFIVLNEEELSNWILVLKSRMISADIWNKYSRIIAE